MDASTAYSDLARRNADSDISGSESLFNRILDETDSQPEFAAPQIELPRAFTADAAEAEKEKDLEKEITATLMVRSRASNEEMDRTLARILSGKQKPLSDAEFQEKFGVDGQALQRVLGYAKENGLEVCEVDNASGRVLLKGKLKQFKEAFKNESADHESPLGSGGRQDVSANLLPRSISEDITGLFGLESKAIVQANVIRYEQNSGKFRPRIGGGMLASDAAKAYDFPEESKGKGQSVAILSFGGGLDLNDNALYYKEKGLPLPDIEIVKINGAKGELSYDPADDEVALDSQVLGTVAPEAKQMIIFAPNSDQGFLDAVTRATFTKEGETPNSVISISWGAPETMWSKQAVENLNLAFKKAALKGITVFAASGDLGARNGTDKFTADYPASDPYVIATGGTELMLDEKGKIKSEETWKDSGGGISEFNQVPDYQKDANLPANANRNGIKGRGVPDIAGNANPATGYKVRVYGFESRMGGTSAVAPLYAGLALRLNSILGERVGYLNPFLYSNGNSDIFRDMQSGDNGGYRVGKGWDAVTGWGVISGRNLLEALKKEKAKARVG